MEDVNNENDYSLSRRENKNQSTLLDAENVDWIVESKLDVVLNNNTMVLDNNDGFVDGNHNHTAEEWNEIATLVKDEGVGMVKTQEKKEAEAKEMNAMEAFIHQLRNKLMASQQGVSFMLLWVVCMCLIPICLAHLSVFFPPLDIFDSISARWKLATLNQSGQFHQLMSIPMTVERRMF